jgi:hypothetical protein
MTEISVPVFAVFLRDGVPGRFFDDDPAFVADLDDDCE